MSDKVFAIVTERITKMLESGTIPWRKPWKAGTLTRPVNIEGREYNGINFFMLSTLPYTQPIFLTMNQIKKMGGRIKEGEEKKHFPVFFWKWLSFDKDKNGNDRDDAYKVPMCRYTLVWNVEQVDGIKIPAKFLPSETDTVVHNPIEDAEAIVNGYKDGPKITTKAGDSAHYIPFMDTVVMPEMGQFEKVEGYYSTLFHELAHSTGHAKRLNRKELVDANAFGSHAYSVEELCAEMGAAYMCAHAGIDNTLENSAAYIASWLKALQNNPRMVMTAAARAQKAFNHIVAPDVAESED